MAAAAAGGLALLAAALAATALRGGHSGAGGVPPRPHPTADDPRANPGAFVAVTFDAYAQRAENDLVRRTILPSFGARRDSPVPFLIGLADVTAQGAFMIFVELTDPKWCDDGCRTLAYRWNGGTWRLMADAKAASVVARKDVFVYRTKSHGDVAWHWRGDGFEREPL